MPVYSARPSLSGARSYIGCEEDNLFLSDIQLMNVCTQSCSLNQGKYIETTGLQLSSTIVLSSNIPTEGIDSYENV